MNKKTIHSIFEESDDGLMTHEVGEHTEQKIHYLRHYMARFVVSMRKKQWRSVNYIDPFCASGKGETSKGKIILGSPLQALSQGSSFDQYFFSDSDSSRVNALKERCKPHPDFSKIKFDIQDANIKIKQIAKEIASTDKRWLPGQWQSLSLAFLDPYGLELHWESVETLARLRTDMIIYYSQMGITRQAPKEINEPSPTHIDLFFGSTQWRAIYKKYQMRDELTLHRGLLDFYKANLAKFDYKVSDPVPEPLITNSNSAPLYRLLFVSKHDLGNRFWTDVNEIRLDGQMSLL